ncbi:hypothetical protein MKL09_05050 [Methylobacterium sp. J-048]|uniref:hypothetical protein n=1 Tax=Methylobacterium sp. J-048 TaxID=2836635 RepID=UPI001FB973C2|nr:hypothetical protein [Methylobacterium sp. J-048]MCJ2055916.1 hypothetical protein [Methylobacterium sp. J-048]
MAETTAFALRMPPEIKAAAKALIKVPFEEPSDRGGDYINSIFLGSINDALCYLLKTGLKGTLVHLDAGIADYSRRAAISGEWMAWFLQNPAASNILPHNLPEGSLGRQELEKMMAPDDRKFTDRPVDPDIEAMVLAEPEPWASGVSRREATDEYAHEQRMLYSLTEAKGVIQKALAARH